MNLVRVIILFILLPLLGLAQLSHDDVSPVNKYLLSSKGVSGELIITTGRIVKAIALSKSHSSEIANIWVDYSILVNLTTDSEGSSTARISLKDLHLTGDIEYKNFNVSEYIFPSCVSFKLYSAGSGKDKQLLASVREAHVNSGNCNISVSVGKNIKEVPTIEQLCFFHSEPDYNKAMNQFRLIERYYTAISLMKRVGQLLDSMQYQQIKTPSAFVASSMEVALLNDWVCRQRFDQYPCFQKVDSVMFSRQILDNRINNKKIEQKFSRLNALSWVDIAKSATIFSRNLSRYFDVGKTDYNRSVYLTQMAGSSMTHIGYKTLLDFVEIYNLAHPHSPISHREIVAFSALIENAIIEQAAKLVDKDQYSDAQNMLKTSILYNLSIAAQLSLFQKELTHNLCQRLYKYNLDIAMMAIKSKVSRVSVDYYRKALSIRLQYPDMVKSDPDEQNIADIACKNIMQSAELLFKSKDITSALSGYDEVIKIAELVGLKKTYEIARARIQVISSRPSGYKPWDERTVDSTSLLAKNDKQSSVQKNGIAKSDTTRLISIEDQRIIDNGKIETAQSLADSLSQSNDLFGDNMETVMEQRIREKLKRYEKNIQFKIRAGEADSALFMLKVADSLQTVLSQNGDNGFLEDLKLLRISYNNMICDQQRISYHEDVERINLLIVQRNFTQASERLKNLIAKPSSAECPIDKSLANQLLAKLEAPIAFKKWRLQLDSVTAKQEPEVIIEAFGKANDYYHSNVLDKWGVEAPDLLAALQSRKETGFLLKAIQLFVNNHQPAYALALLKNISELEPKPDKTTVLQKMVGEMLASGDYAADKNVVDKLNSYHLNERWFSTLISAYKRQWKLFSN